MAGKGAIVTGIDIRKENIETAKNNFHHKNITYIHGDALINIPDENYDAVVISNVLEHIEGRVEFLKPIQAAVRPNRWLIRVPVYERDWRVSLMDELGIDSRLDQTYTIEYREEQLIDELDCAGLTIIQKRICRGEFWCEVKAK